MIYIVNIVEAIASNSLLVAFLGVSLIIPPIVGIMIIHKQ